MTPLPKNCTSVCFVDGDKCNCKGPVAETTPPPRPRPAGLTAEAVELAWWQAHAESIVDRYRKGIL